MFNTSRYLSILVALVSGALLTGCATMPRESKVPASASDLLAAANNVWGSRCQEIENLGFAITRAQIGLQAKQVDQATGSLGILVLKTSASRSVSTGQTLSIGLVPRDRMAMGGGTELEQSLNRAFDAAVRIARVAREQAGSDLLQLRTVRAAVGFDLVETRSGGLAVALGNLSVGGTAGRTTSGAHSLEFEFTKRDQGSGSASHCRPAS